MIVGSRPLDSLAKCPVGSFRQNGRLRRAHPIDDRDRILDRAFSDANVWAETQVDNDKHTIKMVFHVEWRWPWHVLQLLRSH